MPQKPTPPRQPKVDIAVPSEPVRFVTDPPSCHGTTDPPPGYADAKAAYARRLKRIEGQVRGVEKMIDEDRYCIDVLTQISAIQSGLKAVALGLLDEHMAHCVVDAARQGGPEQEQKLAEVRDAIARLVR